MAKKDPTINENIDRQEKSGQTSSNTEDNNIPNDESNSGFTEVKNANASGLGSMGRNDEQEDATSDQSGNS